MDANGKPQPIIMGSYGIGIGRLLACLMQEHRDDAGLIMPVSVTPYHVNLVLLPDGEERISLADRLYAELSEAGVEVLYDDRDKKTASPGIKFKDADLRGFPLRITVSGRALQQGGVEVKLRREADARVIAPQEVVAQVRDALRVLPQELDQQVAVARTWQG